ncbi:MAG: hypothetical protein HY716_03240 [Planctomycetes bacterium]|nr:hypothetical protein [Planctomycetota bacterium]
MKSRNAPNLYEILRAAVGTSVPETSVRPAPPPEPPRPAAEYPAPPREEPLEPETPAEETESEASATSATPAARPLPPEPPPHPAPPASATADEPAAFDPGERSVRVSYNTLLFAGLIAIGTLFLVYSIGVRSGRAQAEARAAAERRPDAPPPAPKAASAARWTIQLCEYRCRSVEERVRAYNLVQQLKLALDRKGYKDGRVMVLGSEPDQRVALLYGIWTEGKAKEAQETLKALRTLRVGKTSFEKTAGFVPAP